MADLPLRPRHYPRPARLVRRTGRDLTEEARHLRAYAAAVTADLRPRPAHPRLVASADGTMARVLLTIPDYVVGAEPLAAAYRDLLRQLPRTTQLVVLTHEGAAAEVRRWLGRSRRTRTSTVVEAPDHLNFSVWAEDGYVVAADEGRCWFVEPFSFPRYADSLVADLVSNATDLDKTQAPLYFQGGNVLVGDDFFLLGADYPAESLEYLGSVLTPGPGETPAALVRRLYGEYLDSGRRLVYVGSTLPVPAQQRREVTVEGEAWHELVHVGNRPGTTQPIFHIDMFVTLVGRGADGRYRLLVGDPRLAATALGQPVAPHAMAEVFDDIARNLVAFGFDVTRNPLPLAYVDDPEEKLRVWYFATSNNALVEVPAAGRPSAWLPTYGHGGWTSLEATDRANVALFRKLGFRTHRLVDFHPFAENLGAVHCIKKYLARG